MAGGTGVGEGTGLLRSVCRTLAGAGFDVASVDGEEAGLRVRQEADVVMVGWEPGAEFDPAERGEGFEGMRAALRQALLVILTQAGYVAQADHASGEIQVRHRP